VITDMRKTDRQRASRGNRVAIVTFLDLAGHGDRLEKRPDGRRSARRHGWFQKSHLDRGRREVHSTTRQAPEHPHPRFARRVLEGRPRSGGRRTRTPSKARTAPAADRQEPSESRRFFRIRLDDRTLMEGDLSSSGVRGRGTWCYNASGLGPESPGFDHLDALEPTAGGDRALDARAGPPHLAVRKGSAPAPRGTYRGLAPGGVFSNNIPQASTVVHVLDRSGGPAHDGDPVGHLLELGEHMPGEVTAGGPGGPRTR